MEQGRRRFPATAEEGRLATINRFNDFLEFAEGFEGTFDDWFEYWGQRRAERRINGDRVNRFLDREDIQDNVRLFQTIPMIQALRDEIRVMRPGTLEREFEEEPRPVQQVPVIQQDAAETWQDYLRRHANEIQEAPEVRDVLPPRRERRRGVPRARQRVEGTQDLSLIAGFNRQAQDQENQVLAATNLEDPNNREYFEQTIEAMRRFADRTRELLLSLEERGNYDDFFDVVRDLFFVTLQGGSREAPMNYWSFYVLMAELYNPDPLAGENQVMIGAQTYSQWRGRVEENAANEDEGDTTMTPFRGKLLGPKKLLIRILPGGVVQLIKQLGLKFGQNMRDVLERVVVLSTDPERINVYAGLLPNFVFFCWDTLFVLIDLMRAAMNKNISITDLILRGRKYKMIGVENSGSVRVLQSFPHLIHTIDNENENFDQDTNYVGKMLSGIFRNYVNEFDSLSRVTRGEDMVIRKIHIDVLLQKEIVQRDLQNRISKRDDVYFTLKLDLLDMFKGEFEYGDWLRLDRIDYMGNNFDAVLLSESFIQFMRDMSTVESAKQWLLERLQNELLNNEMFSQYVNTIERDLDGKVDWNFIFICRLDVKMKIWTKPEQNIDLTPFYNFLPVNCKTAIDGLIKDIGFVSEVTDSGICLYEALWTASHYDEIEKRISIRGRNPYVMDSRRNLILEDFWNEDEPLKNICLEGNYEAMKFLLSVRPGLKHIHIEFWFNIRNGYEMPQGKTKLLVVYDGHCVCSNINKVIALSSKKNPDKIATEEHDEEIEEGNQVYKMFKSFKKIKKKSLQAPDQEQEEEEEELKMPVNCFDYFYDIETMIDHKTGKMTPYLVVVIDPEGKEQVFWGLDTCVQDFLAWFKAKVTFTDLIKLNHKRNEPKLCFWSYNGSKFDLIYLMEGMVGFPSFDLTGSMKNVKSLKVGNASFYDLYKICPFGSLSDTAKFWNIGFDKLDINHDKITREFLENDEENGGENMEKIIEYCIRDCRVLEACTMKYKEYAVQNLKINPYLLSSAALSMRYFRTHYAPPKNKAITGVEKKYYPMLKKSYKGGICQVFRKRQTEDEKEVVAYDINSSYPHVMSVHNMPYKMTGMKSIEHLSLNSVPSTYFGDHNLYRVINLRWKDETIYPTIPRRTKEGLRYEKVFDDSEWIWGVELKFALRTGFVESGSVTDEIYFDSQPLFKKFIKELYERRLESKKVNDKAGDEFYKLIMNSCYGKFGQQIYPKKATVDARKLLYVMELNKTFNHVSDVNRISENIYEVVFKETNYKDNIGGCLEVASYITACARVELWKGVQSITKNFTLRNLFYVDTDSAYTSGTIDPSFLDDNILGKWKKELILEKIICCAPKVYYCKGLKLKNGEAKEVEVCKWKGLPKDNLSEKNYITLLETGKESINSGFVFVRSVGLVTKKANVKNMITVDKRNFIDHYVSNPY